MDEITIIGIDLAKNVFQLHGAATDGSVVFRKKLTRPQFQRFMASHPPCKVAMGAWGQKQFGLPQSLTLEPDGRFDMNQLPGPCDFSPLPRVSTAERAFVPARQASRPPSEQHTTTRPPDACHDTPAPPGRRPYTVGRFFF